MNENVLKMIAGGNQEPQPRAKDAWERTLLDPGMVFPAPTEFEWGMRPVKYGTDDGMKDGIQVVLTTPSSVSMYLFDAEVFEAFLDVGGQLLAHLRHPANERPKG